MQNKVKKIVSSVLKEHFGHIKVESIEVFPGFDEDGDKIIGIRIIFDSTESILTAQDTTKLIRIIVSEINKIDVKSGSDTGFPILSFIAKSELRKQNTDSA